MLLLGSRSVTIEGITIFPDHADPNQFWYLPGPVQLARRSVDRRAAFTFIKYKPAAVGAGAKGGGFLMFEVDLRLDVALERRILSKLSAIARGRPRLAVVPFDEGTVQCIALNVQGSGGTNATGGASGTFNAVEQILGASVPSLDGHNSAAFSLTLSQEGAIILEKAFGNGTTPVGVIYDLKYTGMRPALDVKITADFKRIYDQFSGSLSAQVYFVNAGIDAGFEKLVQDGAIKIEVTDYTGNDDQAEKEKWALDFFKEKLLSEWFQPTLTPGELAGGGTHTDGLNEVLQRANALRPPPTPAPPRPDPSAVPAQPPAAQQPQGPRPTEGSGQGGNAGEGQLHPPPVSQQGSPDQGPTAGTGFPANNSDPGPVEAAGLGFQPSPQQGMNALGGASGGLPALVSFRLKYVRQEELKTVTLEYHRSEATQRTYAPQGFFGLLVADLDRERHFVEVDLDDPFFRVFTVQVDAPIDFARIGLESAQVSLDYGDPSDAENHKHADFTFDAAHHETRKFELFMNAHHDTTYRYGVQYHFSPTPGWEGQMYSYEVPVRRTEDRTLLLNPSDHIGFLEIQILPHKVDWGAVESSDVLLQYSDPTGWTVKKLFTFTSGTLAQTWKLRLNDRNHRQYSYFITHHLKDGSVREVGPYTVEATTVPLDDPFATALDLQFIPLFSSQSVRMVFIDVEYDDPEHHYQRRERLRIAKDTIEPVPLRLSIVDPKKRKYRYRLTFVRIDNTMKQTTPVETEDTLIAIAE